ncbi:MAG: sigma 54-interacting transcriptional regulator [Deltaproteobacteria bacterium]
MASLYLEAPDERPRAVRLIRPVTTIGASEDNDIRVTTAELQPTHAQVSKDGDDYLIVGMLRDMTINGRREKKKTLDDKDIIRIGGLKMTYFVSEDDVPKPPPVFKSAEAGQPQAATVEVKSAYKRVHEFSIKLLENASTESLVDTILDSLVELTSADKGFLVLLEDEHPVVRAARNVERANIQHSLDQLSDSILAKVIETKKPVVVADALADEQWSASESIVHLGLHSVMCSPLLARGELLGLLYVGNNRITNLFDDAAMDVMSVFSAQASLLLSQAQRIDELHEEKTALEDKLEDLRFGTIVGACNSMREVFKRVRKVATADISVLITGETGTGKELIAKEIHENSRRKKGPFIVINCGAIPENLLESELFGHVRGAFTGAVANKIGRFQAANGGTLFLDEIGEMPLPLQVKLLRALQEHVVQRVGDATTEPVDIRVVAATNRILEDEIKAGRFREDLYYRLNAATFTLPPLRERLDFDALVERILKRAGEEAGIACRLDNAARLALRAHHWPGNLRELSNVLKVACVLAEGGLIDLESLPDAFHRPPGHVARRPSPRAVAAAPGRDIRRELDACGGNVSALARKLGVDRSTVHRWLKRS